MTREALALTTTKNPKPTQMEETTQNDFYINDCISIHI